MEVDSLGSLEHFVRGKICTLSPLRNSVHKADIFFHINFSLHPLRTLELLGYPSGTSDVPCIGNHTNLRRFRCVSNWSSVLLYVYRSCSNDFNKSWIQTIMESSSCLLHVSVSFTLVIAKMNHKESFCFRISVIPVLLCPGLGSIFACGLVFACGVVYGMMGLGKKWVGQILH